MGALLKLYQFNPTHTNMAVVVQILLKSLTNLPHTDFVLCKCLLSQEVLEEPQITNILYLADLLEMCQFKVFWERIHQQAELIKTVAGFEDSIRRFFCHVISITYQTIEDKVVGELLGLVQDNPSTTGWSSTDGSRLEEVL